MFTSAKQIPFIHVIQKQTINKRKGLVLKAFIVKAVVWAVCVVVLGKTAKHWNKTAVFVSMFEKERVKDSLVILLVLAG